MNVKKNEAGNLLPMVVTKGATVNVLPNMQHEYLMTTKEVSCGYGTTKYVVHKALLRHESELIEGKHFIKGVDILSIPSIQPKAILWTKRGIVRLGFFIKSERAKLFRDWAEELIIKVDELACMVPVQPTVSEKKRLINRLDRNRMVRLLAMSARIEDSDLRNELVNELMGGYDYGTI